jgi:hypothetical protein
MESTDPLNSTTYESIIYFKSTPQADNTHGLINVLQQSQYEEAQANNGLKSSILMHIFVILATAAIIVFDMTLVSAYKRDDPYSININFALLNFNINLGKKAQKYKYYCFQRSDPETYKFSKNTICAIPTECSNSNLDLFYIVEDYDMTCDNFKEFGIIGLIVRINF